jgi:hypothetical protein
MECSPAKTCDEELDLLEDIQLRSFNENDQTPSSGTTTLPTPNEHQFPLTADEVEKNLIFWETPDSQEENQIPVPAAPHQKDLDSFTDGTGVGSFDFLSSHPGDLFPPPLEDRYHAALETEPSDHMQSIVMWREDVRQSVPMLCRPLEEETELLSVNQPVPWPTLEPPICPKRPRSTTSDTCRKRLKPSSISPSFIPLPSSTPGNGGIPPRERCSSAPALIHCVGGRLNL